MEINIECNKIEKAADNFYYVELSNSSYRINDLSLTQTNVRLSGLDEEAIALFSIGKEYIINIRKSRKI